MVSTDSFWSANALRDAPACSSSLVPTRAQRLVERGQLRPEQRRLLLEHPDVGHHLQVLLVGGRRDAGRRQAAAPPPGRTGARVLAP